MTPCHECGSMDRFVSIGEEIKMLEMLKLKAKDNCNYRLFDRKTGKKKSHHGRIADEFLEYDHSNSEVTKKTHIIKEQQHSGNWEVVHDEREEYPAKRRPKPRKD